MQVIGISEFFFFISPDWSSEPKLHNINILANSGYEGFSELSGRLYRRLFSHIEGPFYLLKYTTFPLQPYGTVMIVSAISQTLRC